MDVAGDVFPLKFSLFSDVFRDIFFPSLPVLLTPYLSFLGDGLLETEDLRSAIVLLLQILLNGFLR